MQLSEANDILSKIKFLNFRFNIEHNFGGYLLTITINAPDSRNRKEIIKVIHTMSLHLEYFDDPQIFIQEVWEFVVRTLRHEAGELFLVDGNDPFNEHEPSDSKWGIIHAIFKNNNYGINTTFKQKQNDEI